jgi:hypothetical protein
MPRLAGPATLVAAGVLIVGFALNADVWDSQSHFGPPVLTADQALAPERDEVRVEPRRKKPAAVTKQRPASSEPGRSVRVQRQSETAATQQPDVRLRPARQARTVRSSRAQRPSRRARAKVGKAPITGSPPAAPVAPPPESAPPVTSPPPAAGGPTASAPPPVSPPPNVAPVSPAPRVPVTGAATPPLRVVPDPARLPAAHPVVPASDEDEDGDDADPDDRDHESALGAVDGAEQNGEDDGFGGEPDDGDDNSEEDEDDGGGDD